MKRSYILRVAICCLLIVSACKTADAGSKIHLEVNSVVKQFLYDGKNSEAFVDSAKIVVLDVKKKVVGTYYSNKFGRCNFVVPLFKKYMVYVSKNGYVMKMIDIDTRLSNDNRGTYTLPCDIYLFEKVEGVDVSILNTPVAKVFFSVTTNTFKYNKDYTDFINDRLKLMYTDHYQRSEKPDSVHTVRHSKVCLDRSAPGNTPESYCPDGKCVKEELGFVSTYSYGTEVKYQVQLISLSTHIATNSYLFNCLGKVDEEYKGGFYVYTVGGYMDMEHARGLLESTKELGFKNAVIIETRRDIRIPKSGARKTTTDK